MYTDDQIPVFKIKEAVREAKKHGMSVSEYTIRRGIKEGTLRCRVVGRTYLIAWDALVRWVLCDDAA